MLVSHTSHMPFGTGLLLQVAIGFAEHTQIKLQSALELH
jgi:hypothetical protein